MRRTFGKAAAVVGLTAAIGTQAAERTDALAEIIVTAERAPSDLWMTPWAAHRLGVSAADGLPSADLPERLGVVPSVLPQKTAHGQGSPFLRGFTGFRTLLLVDGIRLNNAAFREGPNQYWNTVDHLSLSEIEVVMGPGSVLYGSDAIGGVAQALTADPPPADGAPWTARTFYRGASAERSHLGRVEVGARPDPTLGLVLGFSAKRYGDLQGGSGVGRQRHTGYGEWDADGKLVWDLSERAQLTLGHQSVRQDDVWRTHRTVDGLAWRELQRGKDRELFYDQGRDLTWLRLRVEELPGIDEAIVTIYRQFQREDEYRLDQNFARNAKGFDVTSWGALAQLATETRAGRWVYGVDAIRDIVDSYSHGLAADGSVKSRGVQGPVADDATYDTVGAFAQTTLSWRDGAAQVTPGARLTHVRLNAERVARRPEGRAGALTRSWQAAVGSLRASVALDADQRVRLFGGVSQGFRAPNLSDLTRLDIARSGEVETPVDDLDPERFIAGEVGLKVRAGGVTGQAAYYRTWIDGMIVRTPTGRVLPDGPEVTKKNAGDGFVEGVDLAAEWRAHRDWTVRFAGAWMDGEVDGYPTSAAQKEREYLSRIMPLTGHAALRWQPEGAGWWVEAAVSAAAKADRLSSSDRRDTQRIPPGGTPGYVVGTLSGGLRLWGAAHLTLAVENVTDEDYRIHGSGVNAPGRNFVVAIDARF